MSSSSSSSNSGSISENLDKILKFDFANNVKIVLSKPQSGSLSKYIRIVADGFKKYNVSMSDREILF